MLDISGILDDVVHQFTDPLAFFRELIQNAIDAGTGEVDIDVTFDGEAATASVRDFGGGMTHEIIETQLCRLFSSAKHGDLTKIGRFGIGFVSVYGVDPDFVCVDTGRDGDSWRVLFLPDRTWELYALRQPVEGTHVRVVKEMTRDEFDEFRERSQEVVRHWCRHVRIPVRFDGHDIREPFEVDSPCAVEFEEEGTRLVAGLVEERSPRCGFYNRGLMLKETEGSPWSHFEFKIDSRYLEHTLTRDDLMQDRNYDKASQLLERFATVDLPQQLMADLERAVAAGDRTADRLFRLVDLLARNTPERVAGWKRRAVIPTLDGPVTPEACERAARNKELWVTTRHSVVARQVARHGGMVIDAAGSETLERLLRLRLRNVEDVYVYLDARPWSTEPRAGALVGALRKLLSARQIDPERIWLGHWHGDEVAHCTGSPERPAARRTLERSRLDAASDSHLVLNRGHDLVEAALEFAAGSGDRAMIAAAAVVSSCEPRDADEVVRAARRRLD